MLKEKEAEVLRKRKRNDDGDGDEAAPQDGKRMKAEEDADAAEARRREKAARKKEKRERKKEKKTAQKAKADAKKARQSKQPPAPIEQQRDEATHDSDSNAEAVEPTEMEGMDFAGLEDSKDDSNDMNADADADADADDAVSHHSSAPTTPIVASPAFDLGTNHSAASSSSSIVPPSVVSKSPKSPQLQTKPTLAPAPAATAAPATPSSTNPFAIQPSSTAPTPRPKAPMLSRAEAQDRLKGRIEAMRAARKADGPDGKPARSRAELLDQRRQQDAKRKTARKEQRAKEKEEESRRREEQLRGSGSPLSMDMFSPLSPQPSNYSFSRLAFHDGTAATSNLSGLQEAGKKKGPQDPATALKAAQIPKPPASPATMSRNAARLRKKTPGSTPAKRLKASAFAMTPPC